MRAAPFGAVVEVKRRVFPAEPEQVGQVLVGTFFPAGRPDELVGGTQAVESLSTAINEAVRHAVDRMHAAGGRSVVRKPEDAQHAIHVHEQHWKL